MNVEILGREAVKFLLENSITLNHIMHDSGGCIEHTASIGDVVNAPGLDGKPIQVPMTFEADCTFVVKDDESSMTDEEIATIYLQPSAKILARSFDQYVINRILQSAGPNDYTGLPYPEAVKTIRRHLTPEHTFVLSIHAETAVLLSEDLINDFYVNPSSDTSVAFDKQAVVCVTRCPSEHNLGSHFAWCLKDDFGLSLELDYKKDVGIRGKIKMLGFVLIRDPKGVYVVSSY